MKLVTSLAKKINSKQAIIGIIGMGYVGSALAELIIENNFTVIGFEINQKKVDSINKQQKKLLRATTDTKELQTCDIILVCVQTPVYEDKTPNLGILTGAIQTIASHLQKGQLLVIESSIAAGTTRNIVLPILETTGLQSGKDFFLAFSPERVDPGNKDFSLGAIPKVVAGHEKDAHTLAVSFYQKIMKQVVPVSTLETAEMVKIFENTFRLINISLVNEVRDYTKSIDVDIWEVIQAAATKPFGFLPHYPSPGVGGHCIPVDPFYLLDDAKKRGISLDLIEHAGKINDNQPVKVVAYAMELLSKVIASEARPPAPQGDYPLHGVASPRHGGVRNDGQETWIMQQIGNEQEPTLEFAGQKGGTSFRKKNKILLIGITYKPNIDDVRESPALKIWELFEKAGCEVSYHDPFVPSFRNKTSVNLSLNSIDDHDMIVIITNHSTINYDSLAAQGKPILDTRNVFKNITQSHIYHM